MERKDGRRGEEREGKRMDGRKGRGMEGDGKGKGRDDNGLYRTGKDVIY
jgi:hypothetical protein